MTGRRRAQDETLGSGWDGNLLPVSNESISMIEGKMERRAKMRTVRIVLVLSFSVLLLSAVMLTARADEPRQDVLYYCNCGPECNCNSLSTHPGNCKCGQPMKWGHVLKIEGNEAIVCTCDEGCKCNLDRKDPTKCSCGKPVKRINLKGTGIYFCNCGGSCMCNTVSDKPGKCKCSMQLKRVD